MAPLAAHERLSQVPERERDSVCVCVCVCVYVWESVLVCVFEGWSRVVEVGLDFRDKAS